MTKIGVVRGADRTQRHKKHVLAKDEACRGKFKPRKAERRIAGWKLDVCNPYTIDEGILKLVQQCATRQQISISQVRLGGCIPRDWQGQGVTGLSWLDIGVAEKQRNGPTSKLNVGVGFRIGLENDQWLAERPWMKEGYD